MTQIVDVSPTRGNTDLTEDADYQGVSGRMLSLAVAGDGRLYAGSYANVWVSLDGGANFTQATRPQPPPGSFDVPDALDGWEVFDLAVSPTDPDLVLAVTRYDLRSTPRHGIYRSTDGGNGWTLVHQFPNLPTSAGQIVWMPGEANTVFVAWGTSVAISRDAGATFSDALPWGMGSGSVYHLAVAPANAPVPTVYALGNNRMWVSLDGGATWQADAGPVPTPSGAPSGDAHTNAPQVLVTFPNWPVFVLLLASDGTLWLGSYLFFATTGQSAWTQLAVPKLDKDEGDSGNCFIAAVPSGRLDALLFYCAKSRLYVGPIVPSAASDWRRLDEGHHVHVDLHGVFFSSDFAATLDSDGYHPTAGNVWLLSDGGIHRSHDGGRHFTPAATLSTLGTVNISGVAQSGKTALCLNTGDNSGFYSLDGGAHWKTQDYLGGDNDCSYADPLQPDRMLVFTPRDGDNGSITLYLNPSGGLPDGRKGTSQGHQIPAPPKAHGGDHWNAGSGQALRGHRPIVLTRRGETPLSDGDYVFIRYKTDGTAVLLRTQSLREITSGDDWDTLATGPGAKVFQQGPPLPANDAQAAQASGGHQAPVFYVGIDGQRRLWKWNSEMAGWRQLVPGTGRGGPQQASRFFVDPYRPAILFVVDNQHVWRSEDGGATFVIDSELERQATNDGALSPSLDNGIDVVLEDMQFDPDDGLTRYAVGAAGAFFTVDGVSWNRLLDATALPGRPTSCYYDAVSDPCQRALYVGLASRGILKLTPLPWGALQAPDPVSWTDNVVIAGQKSKAPPALAVFRGVVHMVHLGDSSNDLWWSTSTDGLVWTDNVRIPGQKSRARPALAVFNDALHMVYIGTSSNDLWWSIFDGTSWNRSDGTPGAEKIPNQKSKAGPALAVYGGGLHMVHLGDTSNHIWWSIFDGTSWKKSKGGDGNESIIGQLSKSSPALAAFGGKLHMVHLGDSSNHIWWSSFDGDTWWSNTRIRCQLSKAPPEVAVQGGVLHMMHLGDSSNQLWWSIYDGGAWTPNLTLHGQQSKATPALTPLPDGSLLMVHLGDSSNNLWRSLK